MSYGLIYRMEFKNIEGHTIRTDISPVDVPINKGVINPTEVVFYGSNFLDVYYGLQSFFYIGQVFTVSGTASNNGNFTVVSVGPYNYITTVEVAQVVVPETTFVATLTDTSLIVSPVIIPLVGSGTPLVISSGNNDEDKFSQIRSKSAKIQFVSDSSIGLDSSTFSQGPDDLFKVDIYLQDGSPELIFTGFLMMADNQQPFQPDPQYVTLTATDHLAALKEIAWTDYAGVNPVDKYRVADCLAMALSKTGLSLNIYVVNNLRAGGGQFTMAATITLTNTITVADTKMFYVGQRLEITTTAGVGSVFVLTKTPTVITIDGAMVNVVDPAAIFLDYNSQFHWYDVVYLDAKTFEKGIAESESCYDVLNKILSEDCFITQWKGNWWIMRTDEMEGNLIYVAEFTEFGVYVSTAAGTTYDKSIGIIEDSKFANADALLRFVRPHGFIKETFNFDTPLEVPCNVDFEHGALLTTVSSTEKHYTLDCWPLYKIFSGAAATSNSAYIRRLFNEQGYETDRYVVVTWPSDPTESRLACTPIQVSVKDKFVFGWDFRWSSDSTSGTINYEFGIVRLDGDDGSVYFLDNDGHWYLSNSGWTVNYKRLTFYFDTDDVDETQWQTVGSGSILELGGSEFTIDPVPVSGNLIINITWGLDLFLAGRELHISNFTFEYIPYINGSYQKYSGQSSRIDRILPAGYMANRDKNVSLSDSPVRLYKGAMFLLVDSAYILFPYWFAAAPQGNSYPPNTDYLHPYGYIQAFSVWNQYKGYNDPANGRGIGINIFSGLVYGLTDSWPDLLHKYTLTDANTQTANRYFMLLSLQQDWRTCIWTATLIEVFNTAIGKTYGDPFEFRYISE